MEVIKLTLGQLATNAYILKIEKQVIIVDPGSEVSKIKAEINDDEKVVAVLLTHGHFDHIGAVDEIVDSYNCPVYIHKTEEGLLNNPKQSFHNGILRSAITYFDNDFKVANFDVKIYHTPGHTIGGVIYLIDKHLFTGDTLLNRTVGRQDLPTGSPYDMRASLELIKTIKEDYPIYPGHGNISTLFNQFQNNPYLQ